MFERFTEKAIKTVMLAQEESRRFGHKFIGSEQILLGLIGVGGSLRWTLKAAGLDLQSTRLEVEKIIGRENTPSPIELPFTPRAKRVLELSWDEAKKRNHKKIDAEHLLLALIRENEGVAARVFENMNVDISKLSKATIALFDRSEPDKSDELDDSDPFFMK
jgi:ATP-dependent Clp protease ATP-binding subunit ClpC